MKPLNRNLTTRRHFEIFKKEAELWIGRFGLYDWRIEFAWGKSPLPGCRAWYMGKPDSSIGTMGLEKDWEADQPTDHEVKICALHEVLHFLFCHLEVMAELRTFDKEDMERETHRLLRRFENLFYGHDSPTFRKV